MKTQNSLKTKLYDLIKSQGLLTYGEMCGWVAEEGFKVSTGERKLRDLVSEELVANTWKLSKRNRMYICGYKLPDGYVEPEQIKYRFVETSAGTIAQAYIQKKGSPSDFGRLI